MTALALALMLLPAADPQPTDWTIDGVKREALVVAPATPTDHPPLVFGWHGHGGSMRNAARSYHVHALWPEAVVVYPQGLNTPGKLTDPEGKKPGWQHAIGAQDDRDLKFFDALLAAMKEKYKIDENRVYSTGHSNGGGFTYLLAVGRPGTFAAIAPSAAASPALLGETKYKPAPVFHAAGEQDPLVKFEWQKQTIERVKVLNGCEATGTEWAKGCTLYKSSKGAPVVKFIHGGTHAYPTEAPELIVKFFKEHVRAKPGHSD
jgi:polyhydroxybutyrate depolymerase